jgi:hypothetical protein
MIIADIIYLIYCIYSDHQEKPYDARIFHH